MPEPESTSFFGDLMGNYGIILTYVMIAIAVLGALFSSVMDVVRDFGKIKQAAIGLGALIAVFGISYALSSSEVPPGLNQEILATLTPATAKNVGTGLVAFYILFFVALAAAVYSEVSRLFK